MVEHVCGARVCVYCDKPAESPMMPLCITHDLHRLSKGVTAAGMIDLAATKGRCRKCGQRVNAAGDA